MCDRLHWSGAVHRVTERSIKLMDSTTYRRRTLFRDGPSNKLFQSALFSIFCFSIYYFSILRQNKAETALIDFHLSNDIPFENWGNEISRKTTSETFLCKKRLRIRLNVTAETSPYIKRFFKSILLVAKLPGK